MIGEIYEDLAKHAAFAGLLFHDDAFLSDFEDANPAALARVSRGGPARRHRGHPRRPGDDGALDGVQDAGADRPHHRTRRSARGAGERRLITARNLYAEPVLNPAAQAWFAQSLPAFLAAYDRAAVMAMPYMEQARDPDEFLRRIHARVAAQPNGIAKTVFELQAADWRAHPPRRRAGAHAARAVAPAASARRAQHGLVPGRLHPRPAAGRHRAGRDFRPFLPVPAVSMMELLGQTLPWIYAFVGYWPLMMMLVWVIGGVIFFRLHEAGGHRDTLPPILTGPCVSIIIPCFNEEDNAAETIRACAAQAWPDFEIIAVNDGSRDNTAAELDRLALEIPSLRVVHLAQNQGKAMALRAGAMVANGEILVCIDGDAILHPDCVAWLVRRFETRPRLGAVTGNPRIRNRSSLLGLLQVGEFSATIGLIKRTQRLIGRVFTVSGVVVAFRVCRAARCRLVDLGQPDRGCRRHLEAAAPSLGGAFRTQRAVLHPDAGDAARAMEAAAALGRGRRTDFPALHAGLSALGRAPHVGRAGGIRRLDRLVLRDDLHPGDDRARPVRPGAAGAEPAPSLLSIWGMVLSVACLRAIRHRAVHRPAARTGADAGIPAIALGHLVSGGVLDAVGRVHRRRLPTRSAAA